MKKSLPFKQSHALKKQLRRLITGRRKLFIAVSAFAVTAAVVISCQKQFTISNEQLLTFQLLHSDGKMFGPDQLSTKITEDSVLILVKESVDITHAYCKVTYVGAAIWPQENLMQNFSSPLGYTVAGSDGTKKTYIVLVTKTK
ncbi:MAG TPA: hypothetical protein VG738_22920 [Chitinophagaceae bacterium]|nr:hypothetical protein [Chitinophagaceae bacterium]